MKYTVLWIQSSVHSIPWDTEFHEIHSTMDTEFHEIHSTMCISWNSVSYGTVYFMELCILWYCVFHGTLYLHCSEIHSTMVLCISWNTQYPMVLCIS